MAVFCDKFHLNTNQCFQELLPCTIDFIPPPAPPLKWTLLIRYVMIQMMKVIGIAEEDEEVKRTSSRANPDQALVNWSFLDAINLLCNPTYHPYDAFPEVCKIYSIPVATPISTCTAERSFSALKRIKTRLRSTTTQERLEDLLMMSVERKILSSLSCDSIIDEFARSSSELFKALL